MKALKYKNIPKDAEYFEQWTEYQKRSRYVRILFISFIPALIGFGYLLSFFIDENKGVFTAFIVWSIFILVAGNYAAFWRCPKCNKPFHIDFGRIVNPLTKKCVHCGLPKWCENSTNAI